MELARLMLGLVVAVSLPSNLPSFQRRPPAALALTALYAAYVVVPVLDGGWAAAVWLTAVGARAAGTLTGLRPRPRLLADRLSSWRSSVRTVLQRVRGRTAVATLTSALLVTALSLSVGAVHGEQSGRVVINLLIDDRISIVLSGFLLAVFSGNLVVSAAIRPYIAALLAEGEDLASLMPVGSYLGWIERALVFVFIAAGQPEAAALAIAAKSLARLPEVQRHQGADFGQYVIVGTLTSLLVAVTVGAVVRTALGLPPL